ncbi:MAG: hypothetical protein IPF59_14230 [Ignavibacteria bacterium]|nr:hypothetical protein [Ignavibacteria bacterium]
MRSKDVITGNRADILSTQAVVTADGSTVLIPGSRRRIDSTFEVLDLTFILRFSDEATSVTGESPEPTTFACLPNPRPEIGCDSRIQPGYEFGI